MTMRVRESGNINHLNHADFLLEGLGGKIEVTESLLTESDLDWAYSELFQTEDRGAMEWYLPRAIPLAERCGPLIHFAETRKSETQV